MPPKKSTPAAAAAAAAASPANQQQLPLKEQALFRQILKFYESKQYKKSLKACDTILKKYPLHGETISMKGLTVSQLRRTDEAHELVKKGLSLNIQSHVCWHVYGLLYRAEHKYDDSIKCYQQAIKRDPENQNILKDLAHLQIQRRMLDGFTETRRKLLVLAATRKNNWIAYAIGNHLSGNHPKALAILDAWNKTQKEDKKSDELRALSYEDSELIIYKNQILEEQGEIEQALAHLDEHEKEVADKLAWKEKKAQYLSRVGRASESESLYRSLLNSNPDNYAYYYGLQQALGYVADSHGSYTQEQVTSLLALYETLSKQHKYAAAPKRLPLAFTTGQTFQGLLETYLQTNLRKGIPSLFRDLRPLYKDPAKSAIIEKLITDYITQLRASRRFTATEEPETESPSTLLWALFYASHHFDHFNNTARALELVDEAIAHTPTTIDLYVLKARIYKHAHDHRSAYLLMDHARRLDTADRYLNTRCVRYAFRADECTKGDETIALFLREGDTPQQSLLDMQVMWYELASGASWFRQKQWGRALKKLTAIDKHFEDMTEDQFDFHTYCLRKATLRAYIQLLRWEDQLRSHRFFFRGAQLLVKIYLRLYDIPREAEAAAAAEADGLSEEEKKKLEKNKKRLAAKAKKQAFADDAKLELESKSQAKQGIKKDADEDPNGDKLAETTTPLEEAAKYVNKLKFYAPDAIETHLLAVQVFLRKEKYLLVLQSLKKGYSIAPDHPELHTAAISFIQKITKQVDTLHPLVKQVIEAERATLPIISSTSTPQQLNQAYLTQHNNSLAHRLAVARCELALTGSSARGRAVELLLSSSVTSDNNLSVCEEVHAFLADTLRDTEAATTFSKQAHTRFPFTPYFGATPPTLSETKEDDKEHKQE